MRPCKLHPSHICPMPRNVHFIIGASGQLGTEFALALHQAGEQVVLSDIKQPELDSLKDLPFECMDVRDADAVANRMAQHGTTHVHHLAAALSARGEKEPQWAWDLNMRGLLNVLEASADSKKIAKVFWPSSIAVFGPKNGPVAEQNGHRIPETVYGISKQAGEQWCAWFRQHRGLDVRSVRYPGLIGELSPPGGGTTDYAVEVFDHLDGPTPYSCFLSKDTVLPMMHMEDAVGAMMQIMSAPQGRILNSESYNIQGLSFDPETLFAEIQQHVSGFEAVFAPDFRQSIADGWPDELNDSAAREDWGWTAKVGIQDLVQRMIVSKRQSIPFPNEG
jgi:nucleoside-diphosphate-sugar epimerase